MSRTDHELIEAVLSGEEAAFKILYDKYVKKVFNLSYRISGRFGDPEELTQEIFYQVYKNLKNFQGKSQFYTWLFRVATNTCLQYNRKHDKSRASSSYEHLEENAPMVLPPSSQPQPETEVEQRLLREDIAKRIATLPEKQKMVMILGPVQGHSYQEMSDILEVSVTVVKGRLHRARESLRAVFNSAGYEDFSASSGGKTNIDEDVNNVVSGALVSS
jgi:RNA polymerase sigma-70 factor (ECF subfamily)